MASSQLTTAGDPRNAVQVQDDGQPTVRQLREDAAGISDVTADGHGDRVWLTGAADADQAGVERVQRVPVRGRGQGS
jgi:hypothetical protein